MKETWRDRAKARMKEKGISQESLARTLGSTRSSIGHYLADRRIPNVKQIEAIAKTLQVHPAWLLYGKQVTEIHEDLATYTITQEHSSKIPITGTSVTGAVNVVESYINLPLPTLNCYALSIIGAEYSPRMYEGEAILVNPDISPSPGDEVVVRYQNDEVKLHSIIKIQKNSMTLSNVTGNQKRSVINNSKIKYIHCIFAIARTNAIEYI